MRKKPLIQTLPKPELSGKKRMVKLHRRNGVLHKLKLKRETDKFMDNMDEDNRL